MRNLWILAAAVGLLLTGCTTLPTGPSVMVLPSEGKDFDQFRYENAVCRQWASEQIGTTTDKAANNAAASGAAVGTVLGGAAGAAVGSAYGDPATGAAVGAGVGLLGGSAVGADNAAHVQGSLQRRYDIAYIQCMYAKGNQVPVPASYQRPRTSQHPPPPPPPGNVPPPPTGSPPPPPPGYSR